MSFKYDWWKHELWAYLKKTILAEIKMSTSTNEIPSLTQFQGRSYEFTSQWHILLLLQNDDDDAGDDAADDDDYAGDGGDDAAAWQMA